MATFKFTGGVSHFRAKLIDGMVANGYEHEFAERTFEQLEGFGSYGFPESHAASFALISYAQSWMKCWHPDVFCAALLNAQPMGFYAPAQVVRDAREHGVEVRPPCVNRSRWDTTLEPTDDEDRLAVRLGLRLTKGLREEEAVKIVVARADQPYASVEELARRSGASVSALERLAEADAFLDGLQLSRRDALWAIKPLRDTALPLFAAADAREGGSQPEVIEPQVRLRPMAEGREVVEDYGHIGLTLRRHPVAFLRDGASGQGGDQLRRDRAFAGRQALHCGWSGAGAPEARQRQGGHVHHHRGRDRGGQPGDLAAAAGTTAPVDPVGRDDLRGGARAA